MDSSTAPVLVEQVRQYPFGLDNNVMDNNEFDVDEFQVGGGFFDDDPLMSGGRAGRQDIRSHLDDLAQRHPEFADSLRGPPWASEMRGGWGGHRPTQAAEKEEAASSSGAEAAAGGAASGASAPPEQQEQSDEPGPLRGRARNNLPQHGLRNTVPDMGVRQAQEEEARGQRSWSAPPDSRAPPQRFVSRLDINPVPVDKEPQPANAARQEQSRPPPAPRPAPKPGNNVRHIPIFVEGRDEPIVPKPDEPTEPHFTSHAQHQFQPHPFPQQKRSQAQQNNPPQQKQPNRSFNSSPRPFQSPEAAANEPPAEEMQQEAPPPPPPPKVVVDPISKVQAIQSEIAGLRAEVEKYSGNSRKDKDYVLIDELLTRNLLKLDDIETEGRDDIRQARKAAIRSIQDCINDLEAKVPLPPTTEEGMEVAVIEAAGSDTNETPQTETNS